MLQFISTPSTQPLAVAEFDQVTDGMVQAAIELGQRFAQDDGTADPVELSNLAGTIVCRWVKQHLQHGGILALDHDWLRAQLAPLRQLHRFPDLDVVALVPLYFVLRMLTHGQAKHRSPEAGGGTIAFTHRQPLLNERLHVTSTGDVPVGCQRLIEKTADLVDWIEGHRNDEDCSLELLAELMARSCCVYALWMKQAFIKDTVSFNRRLLSETLDALNTCPDFDDEADYDTAQYTPKLLEGLRLLAFATLAQVRAEVMKELATKGRIASGEAWLDAQITVTLE